MPRLYVLGSGGWVPGPQRQTDCCLLESRRSLLIFDCGTGLSRLHDPLFKVILERHTRAVVLLSGWSAGRSVGLHYLPYFLGGMEVALGVPGQAVTGLEPEAVLERLLGPPLGPRPFREWKGGFSRGLDARGLGAGSHELLGEEVVVAVRTGAAPELGFRVRDVVYLGGRGLDGGAGELAADTPLLVHPAWLDDAHAAGDPEAAREHATASGAAAFAADVGAGRLLLSHLNPAYDAARVDRMALEACGIFRRTLVATDMMVLDARARGAGEPEQGEKAGRDRTWQEEQQEDAQEGVPADGEDAADPGEA